jgi:hypothetical protein
MMMASNAPTLSTGQLDLQCAFVIAGAVMVASNTPTGSTGQLEALKTAAVSRKLYDVLYPGVHMCSR